LILLDLAGQAGDMLGAVAVAPDVASSAGETDRQENKPVPSPDCWPICLT
jgi:hypothetical protein